ncbi:hypothetical protein AMJ80_06515 [bacterium SM23_31]|nr:MAG: hypothetical protein AMJ80_06515 [bacterium SM23_31]
MRLAVIDIGTNSVLLIAAVITGKSTVRILRDESRIIRLGEDIYRNNKIGEPALRRTLDTLQEYIKICRDLHIEDISILGTEIFRCAENSSEIRDVIFKQTGFPVEVLSGKEEALYTFRSALPEGAENNKDYIVIDIGGGSTEIIIGSPTGQHFTWSLPLGAVILTAGFLNNDPPELSELSKAQKYITERICRLPPIKQEKSAIGIGGTITTLAAVNLNINEFDAAKIEGKLLSKNSIKFILNRFLKLTAHERLSIPGMEKGREDIIIAGTAVLLEFLNYYMLDSIKVSTKGVRYGYLVSKAYKTG